jgi:hypothetical protein
MATAYCLGIIISFILGTRSALPPSKKSSLYRPTQSRSQRS